MWITATPCPRAVTATGQVSTSYAIASDFNQLFDFHRPYVAEANPSLHHSKIQSSWVPSPSRGEEAGDAITKLEIWCGQEETRERRHRRLQSLQY